MFYDFETERSDRHRMAQDAFNEFKTFSGEIYASEFSLPAEGVYSIAISYRKRLRKKVSMFNYLWNEELTTRGNIYTAVKEAVDALESEGL